MLHSPLVIEKKIKHNKTEFNAMVKYLSLCKETGFRGTNNYFNMHPYREYFMQIALNKICSKYLSKMAKIQINGWPKSIIITFDLIELHTLSKMFQRVDGGAYIVAMQSTFVNGLQTINRLTNHLE